MANMVIFWIVLLIWKCNADRSYCRVTRGGSEYKGTIARSLSGTDCLFWSTARNSDDDLRDNWFPDGSKRAARNFCRNPTREIIGPWCYIQNDGPKKEACDVPFCNFQKCRWTGPGEEYNGTINKTIGSQNCMKWSDTDNLEFARDICVNDSSVCGACRNMNSDSSGPWCMTHDGQNKTKRLCEVPFCQQAPVVVGTVPLYSQKPIATFHNIMNTSTLSLKVRLWDPNDWLTGEIALLISTVDVPATVSDTFKWGSGFFVKMSNSASMVAFKTTNDETNTPGILSSVEWTNVTISWKRFSDNLIVYVNINDNPKPQLIAEWKTNDTLMEGHDFKYFSFLGSKSFLDFNLTSDTCLLTTTSLGSSNLWNLLERDFGQATIQLFFITYGTLVISMRESFFDQDLLRVNVSQNGRVSVENFVGNATMLSDVAISPFGYQIWSQINISIIGDTLLITRILESNYEVATNISGVPRHLLWYGISSEAVSHWSANCNPENVAFDKIKQSDCSSSPTEFEYGGVRNIASSGAFCIPWIDKRIPSIYQNTTLFNRFGGRLVSVNFCRNLDYDLTGAFCFVPDAGNNVEKQECVIPACTMDDCKLAGTGTDFSGKLSVTRSGRSCRDPSFCRNQDKSVAGPWCTTEDPRVTKDLCLVQDCEWDNSEIMLVFSKTSDWYIQPHWKKSGINFWIKNWNPENESVVCVTISSISGFPAFKLIIGGRSNEEISLQFVNGASETTLFYEETPHFLKSGKWTALWLRSSPGRVELGYQKKKFPFFEWQSGPLESSYNFAPMFINFAVMNEFPVGIRFQPTECLVERLQTGKGQLWPINLWRKKEGVNEIEFFVQGEGDFNIQFIRIPEDGVEVSLRFQYPEVSFSIDDKTLINANLSIISKIDRGNWTRITFRYSEIYLLVEINGEKLLEMTPTKAVLFYWFQLEIISGIVSWSANCEPLELGGAARNGGWSEWGPWSCSAPCGGGEGFRKRFCNNPRPSLLGQECSGIDIYHGPCNVFPCGDAPSEILEKIRKRLASKAESLAINVGSKIQLHCNEDLATVLSESVPDLAIEWVWNGFTSGKKGAEKFQLMLNEVELSDSGVWVCLANWRVGDEDKSAVLSVTALTVTSQYPTGMARETLNFRLSCNGVILGQIFAELSLKWNLDGAVWHDYGPTTLEAVEIEYIRNINRTHSGVWTCVISQNELGLEWTTAWIKLQVKPSPNFWSHLIQDDATAPIFSSMSEETVKIVFLTVLFFFIVLPFALVFVCREMLKPSRKKRN